ncbi:MAG TPA: SusC/RagA family TonB-linked outer membrane protein [Phnomibacter sp.]|nr:SusC/RagA family TonB-linked outer membrane protein [Phnomibacter sp.]
MRKAILAVLFLVSATVGAWAQKLVVTGKVTDSTGAAVAGASIREKGTKNGVSADIAGIFSLSVTPGATLQISASGFSTKEVKATEKLTVSLKTEVSNLSEVVVTALGIQRQKKDLGYAATKVSNAEMTRANAVNVANGLQGKVSGLNVASINNGVFEDVKINLRGIRSLTGNNNPMLVVDGMPISLGYLSSINPNDIQDVNVLKGTSAASIYGPDARNGVLVVTTKKGVADKPVITLSSSAQFQKVSFFPEFQTKFGSGGYNDYTPYENWSWGPAFDGSEVELGHQLPDGSVQKVPYSPTNAREEFFNTGTVLQNDISFAAKDFYLSVQDAVIRGIVPDDKNRRTGVRLNATKEYAKFKAKFNVNYIQQNYNVFDDAAMADYNAANNVGLNQGLMNLIFNTPAQVPITSYKDFINNPFAEFNGYFNDYGLNPYFAIDNWRRKGTTSDLIASIDLGYKVAPWMDVTFRSGLTQTNTIESRTSKGETPTSFGVSRGFSLIPGTVSERSYNSRRLSTELFASFNKTVGDFKLNAVLGTYVRDSKARDSRVGASNLVVPELFNVNNRTGELTGASTGANSRIGSVYGSASVNYKGWANLEFTGRGDRTSVLGIDNNTYFYPGVSGSVVLNEAIDFIDNMQNVSLLKIRAAWNKTGNADIDPYLLAGTYSQASGFPYGGLAGFTANNTSYDPNLKPEFINSIEVGMELGLFRNRVGVEVSYFNQKNDNQIIPISVSSATSFTNAFVNAASFTNKGVEMDLRLTPLFKFNKGMVDLKINAMYNDNEITKIYDGLDELAIGGYASASNYAIKGYPAYVIKATDYKRDDQGRVIVNANTGYPVVDPNTKIFGRTLPTWILGINPSVTWHGVTLSALAEYKGGHYAYNDIGNAMAWTGVSAATGNNNREKFVFPNSSIETSPGKFVPNTNVTITNVNDFYTGVFRSVYSNFITSAAAWRLREVVLSYDLPSKWLGHGKVVKGLSVALTGRNLLLFVPKTNQFSDPDFNFTTGNTAGISNSTINPPVRTMGGNITVRF